MRAVSLVLVSILAAGLVAMPASAQACGPLTFAFSGAGPGCNLAPPLLSGAVVPPGCIVRFTLTPTFPIPIYPPLPAFLILGATNPNLSLAPYDPFWAASGCNLLAYPDVIIPMSPGPTPGTASATISVNPSVVPIPLATFQQVFYFPNSPVSPNVFYPSNGVRMDIT